VAFTDPNNVDSKLLYWAIDLDIHLTDATCIATFQDFLLNGKLNEDASEYQIRIKVENKVDPVLAVVWPEEESQRSETQDERRQVVDGRPR